MICSYVLSNFGLCQTPQLFQDECSNSGAIGRDLTSANLYEPDLGRRKLPVQIRPYVARHWQIILSVTHNLRHCSSLPGRVTHASPCKLLLTDPSHHAKRHPKWDSNQNTHRTQRRVEMPAGTSYGVQVCLIDYHGSDIIEPSNIRNSFFDVIRHFEPAIATAIINHHIQRDIRLTLVAREAIVARRADRGSGVREIRIRLNTHLELQTTLCAEYRYAWSLRLCLIVDPLPKKFILCRHQSHWGCDIQLCRG